ncbi:conserved hypothetical protein [Histoplasma mississippiense (nom. inval.)]|uniref:conserved hypothetical protein n=1 Tax=Ajellomyces capsulatus (strain NAm1 / WU24) TaxID=2059318 RepID=UPI000157D3C4|nr:conserved hypothetical protein [Histoplasma mississippiense (nom. inval.)]EDN04690.1 conserved hypothetical protein [Histoplasma mississippiense (nom. inval.)]
MEPLCLRNLLLPHAIKGHGKQACSNGGNHSVTTKRENPTKPGVRTYVNSCCRGPRGGGGGRVAILMHDCWVLYLLTTTVRVWATKQIIYAGSVTPRKDRFHVVEGAEEFQADSPSAAGENGELTSHAPLSYLVVATAELGRRIPFAFLLEIRRKFLTTYNPESTDFSSLPPYGCAAFNTHLRELLQTYNTAPPADSLASARKEIDSVRGIMTENIERVLERGERIDLLVDKTDRLGGSARDFRVRSRGLRRQMWWKNVKVMALLVVVVVFLIC